MPRTNVAVLSRFYEWFLQTRLLTVVTLRDCLFAYRMLAHKLLRLSCMLDDELRTIGIEDIVRTTELKITKFTFKMYLSFQQ